ncbi:hypothetical protein [Companilactobacillus metriopterae]|uniref:hypothetical protein n=1 Tax=Companilactobacillus metriopterae TaxID=1909267 RepID=UPI00100AFAA3|nr:hypothetical protein [Companilactobacillus metriopterae]
MKITPTKNILNSVLELVSYYIFPIIYIWHYNLSSLKLNITFTIMLGMIAFYKNFFKPYRPNTYFNIFYSVLFIVICAFSIKSLNVFVMILLYSQLLLLFISKTISRNLKILDTIIESFIVPSFCSIAISFVNIHFISFTFIIPVLLVNIAALIIDFYDGENIFDYLQLIFMSAILIILYYMKYIELTTSIAIIVFIVIMALIKNHFKTSNLVNRIIGNLLLII